MRTRQRWLVLGVYALTAGVTQMLWLNFAPLLSLVQQRYGVSELLASTLVLVFPLLYVALSLPAGALVDSRGYRFTVGLGACLTAAFAALRIYDGSFWVLLAAQVGIAIAQPFVLNGISKLVADWFEPAEGAIATGIGTMGMFLGMAVGMAATPALEVSIGLSGAMAVFFGIAVVAAALFLWLVHPRQPVVADSAPSGVLGLLRNRQLVLLCLIAFVGLGQFNGLTTWLEELLKPHGVNAENAGLAGGVLILGGLVGAVVIPLWSDKVRRRKPFLLACTACAAVCTWPLCTTGQLGPLFGFAAAMGFFFMPAFSLLLDMSSRVVGERHAGGATSLLMLAGNLGGVVVIIAIPFTNGGSGGYGLGVGLLVALLLVGVGLELFARETSAT